MKQIRTRADLAINGAPPAFTQPLHVGRPNLGDHEAFLDRVRQILESQWLTNDGPMVREFESRVAARLGVKHCVAMCNGTLALEIAVRALGLEGEVIIPSWTFVATAHALHWQGITPVFADIDPETQSLDPAAVQRMITPRTTGIIGVHLWGRAAAIDELRDIANAHGLKLLFDAAHAFGSTYKGQLIGRFGSCEVFSFHATKAFNTMEGGAIVTNDDELADAVRLMRNFGFRGYDNVVHPGTNGKMIEACAAMGLTNLDYFDEVVIANRRTHAAYSSALSGVPGVSVLQYPARDENSHHYVVLQISESCTASRDEIVAALQAENVLARKYFWPGCHRMAPYRDLYPHAGLLLESTERVASATIVLPAGPVLKHDEIDAVCSVVSTLCGEG